MASGRTKRRRKRKKEIGSEKCLISEGEVERRRKRRKSFGEGKIGAGRGLVFIKDSIIGPRRPKTYVIV